MALTITPGYDFGVNEVPTRAKLESMLDNMTIANIPAASVDGSISVIAYGWLTGATMATLANQGDVLYDISGRMWVKTNNGVASLYNSGFGGYETVRFKCADPLEPAIDNPAVDVDNFYGQIQSLDAANQNFNNVWYRPSTTQGQDVFYMHQVTTVSGAKIRLMLCGTRRSTMLWDTGADRRDVKTNSDTAFAWAIEKDTLANNEWNLTEFPSFNDNAEGLGPVFGLGGSMEANNIRCPSYLFGAMMMVI